MIIVAGEALVDRIVAPDGSIVDVPGGGPFNTARAIGRFGLPVSFLGCLSTDRSGIALRKALLGDGVNLDFTVASDAPTTLAIAMLGDDGNATYRFETNGTAATLLDAQTVRAALAAAPEALHVGALGLVLEPMATALLDGLAEAKSSILVMVDPNCRPAAIDERAAYLERLLAVLRRADVVKASREDLAYLWPASAPGDAIARLLALGPAAVVVTDGPRPVVCATSDGSFEVPVPRVAVVDTIGAGDAFGGAFLARWIERGLRRAALLDAAALEEAARLAIAAAAATCGRAGADPPRRDEIGWPRA